MRCGLPFAALALLVATPAYARIDQSSFASLAFRQHPGAQLPLDAELRDETGRPMVLGAAFGGRPAVLVLEYLRCQNLCSLVLSGATAAMVRAGLRPGKNVSLVAVSIDPRDTPADAARARAMYAGRFPDHLAAASGIRFLTGDPGQVARIADAVGFPYRFDRQTSQYAHPAGIVVATPDGRISRYMLGLNPDPGSLRQAIGAAAAEKVEPPEHPLLCLCFGYDPDEGSVAALTWQLVRIVSLLILLACAALIGSLALHRRRAA
jgi:protein SCO1